MRNKNFQKIIAITLFLSLLSGIAYSQQIDTEKDNRMQWWREARFGMFIHWGLYSIPAGEWKGKEVSGIGEWIMNNAKIPVTEYRDLAKQFNPEKFDAKAFVEVAKKSGMKYITLTTKHHDGFAMFKSYASTYNIVDATPYHKDLFKELADECHKQGIKICCYYSQVQDWNEANGIGNTWDFPENRDFQKYLDEKVKPQLTELLTNYGKIDMIWFDTPLTINNSQAQSLKDLVQKIQPTCIISGRLGGGVMTDYQSTGDNVIPPSPIKGDWEVPATLNNTWGYKKNDHHWKSPETITRFLFDIVAKGGNYLLNVGPDAQGLIPSKSVNILKQVGGWMSVNHDAIYGTSASPFGMEFKWGNITYKDQKLYLGFFNWPSGDFYLDGLKNKIKKANLLSNPKKKIAFASTYNKLLQCHRLKLNLSDTAPDKTLSVVVLEIEGTPEIEKGIKQQHDGSVTLPLVLADVYKNTLKTDTSYLSPSGRISVWKESEVSFSWNFLIEKPGTYQIDLVSTETGSHENPEWIGGHVVKISMNDQFFETLITADSKEINPRSRYWKKVHTNGKSLTFDNPGNYTIKLSSVSFASEKGFPFLEMNLYQKK